MTFAGVRSTASKPYKSENYFALQQTFFCEGAETRSVALPGRPPYVVKSERYHKGSITIHVAEVADAGVFVDDCAEDPFVRWSRGSESLKAAQAEADAALLAAGHRCDGQCGKFTSSFSL